MVESWDDVRAKGFDTGTAVTDWYQGKVAIVIGDVFKLERPVAARGALWFWRLPDVARAAVLEQVGAAKLTCRPRELSSLTSTVMDAVTQAEDQEKHREKRKR